MASSKLTATREGVVNKACPGDNSERRSQDLEDSTQSEVPVQTWRQTLFSWRALMATQLCLYVVLSIMLKTNINVALVCMLKAENTTSLTHQNATSAFNTSDVVTGVFGLNRTGEDIFHKLDPDNSIRGEFDWDSSIQGLVLASVNILSCLAPAMNDIASQKLGPKTVAMSTTFICGILTLFHPVGARLSAYVLVALRLAIGLFTALVVGMATEILTWWSPVSEKVTLFSLIYGGVNIGSVLSSISSGYLCSVSIDNGWPFVFYAQGGMCLVWCILWQFTGTTRPEDHPFISENEKQYILKTRASLNLSKKRGSPPYKKIAQSKAVWGYITSMTCHVLGLVVFFSYLPLYLTQVFGISVENVGLIMSLGFILRFASVMFWGQASNLLLNKTRMSLTACRKTVQCTGFYLAAAALIGLGFADDQLTATIIIFCFMTMMSSSVASCAVAPLDIAPIYAGFLSSLHTSIGALVAFVGPIFASMMTQNGTREEYRNLFIFLSVTYFFGATVYLFLFNAELKSWAKPGDQTDERTTSMHVTDGMGRRLSVGPPLSPTTGQKRFNFTSTSLPESFCAASINFRPDIQCESSHNDHSAQPSNGLSYPDAKKKNTTELQTTTLDRNTPLESTNTGFNNFALQNELQECRRDVTKQNGTHCKG